MTHRENLIKNYQVPLTVGIAEKIKNITGGANSQEALQLALLEFIEIKEEELKKEKEKIKEDETQ